MTLRITGMSCRTNIPPNNAFASFGVPQGTFAIESALTPAAQGELALKVGVEEQGPARLLAKAGGFSLRT